MGTRGLSARFLLIQKEVVLKMSDQRKVAFRPQDPRFRRAPPVNEKYKLMLLLGRESGGTAPHWFEVIKSCGSTLYSTRLQSDAFIRCRSTDERGSVVPRLCVLLSPRWPYVFLQGHDIYRMLEHCNRYVEYGML